MILIGVGSNLTSTAGGPLATCKAALARLEAAGLMILGCSPWYETAPVPVSDQPWFVNAVAEVATDRDPAKLLAVLHQVEAAFGRVRGAANASRTLDLDLLAYGSLVWEESPPLLPHPRLHERAFVLFPLKGLAPAWRHPVLGLTAEALIGHMPPGQQIRPLAP